MSEAADGHVADCCQVRNTGTCSSIGSDFTSDSDFCESPEKVFSIENSKIFQGQLKLKILARKKCSVSGILDDEEIDKIEGSNYSDPDERAALLQLTKAKTLGRDNSSRNLFESFGVQSNSCRESEVGSSTFNSKDGDINSSNKHVKISSESQIQGKIIVAGNSTVKNSNCSSFKNLDLSKLDFKGDNSKSLLSDVHANSLHNEVTSFDDSIPLKEVKSNTYTQKYTKIESYPNVSPDSGILSDGCSPKSTESLNYSAITDISIVHESENEDCQSCTVAQSEVLASESLCNNPNAKTKQVNINLPNEFENRLSQNTVNQSDVCSKAKQHSGVSSSHNNSVSQIESCDKVTSSVIISPASSSSTSFKVNRKRSKCKNVDDDSSSKAVNFGFSPGVTALKACKLSECNNTESAVTTTNSENIEAEISNNAVSSSLSHDNGDIFKQQLLSEMPVVKKRGPGRPPKHKKFLLQNKVSKNYQIVKNRTESEVANQKKKNKKNFLSDGSTYVTKLAVNKKLAGQYKKRKYIRKVVNETQEEKRKVDDHCEQPTIKQTKYKTADKFKSDITITKKGKKTKRDQQFVGRNDNCLTGLKCKKNKKYSGKGISSLKKTYKQRHVDSKQKLVKQPHNNLFSDVNVLLQAHSSGKAIQHFIHSQTKNLTFQEKQKLFQKILSTEKYEDVDHIEHVQKELKNKFSDAADIADQNKSLLAGSTCTEKRKPGRPKGSKNKLKISNNLLGGYTKLLSKKVKDKSLDPIPHNSKKLSSNSIQFKEKVFLKSKTSGHIKRPPGRPRKYPLTAHTLKGKYLKGKVNFISNVSDQRLVNPELVNSPTVVKRKPGRPRKIPVQETSSCSTTGNESCKLNCKNKKLTLSKDSSKKLNSAIHKLGVSEAKLSSKFESCDKNNSLNSKSSGHFNLLEKRFESDSESDYENHLFTKRFATRKSLKKLKSKLPSLSFSSSHTPSLGLKVSLGNLNFLSKYQSQSIFGLRRGLLRPSSSQRLLLNTESSVGTSKSSDEEDFDQQDDLTRKKKKKKKLLYFKSKHKNIVDPVLESNVSQLVRGFTALAISPPDETVVLVRPGEVPLPSIFRLTKINLKSKKKEVPLLPERIFEKPKKLKGRKEKEQFDRQQRETQKPFSSIGSEEDLHHIFGLGLTNQQCLPPKKRHKLFSSQTPLSFESISSAASDTTPKQQEKRKVGRPRKHPLTSQQTTVIEMDKCAACDLEKIPVSCFPAKNTSEKNMKGVKDIESTSKSCEIDKTNDVKSNLTTEKEDITPKNKGKEKVTMLQQNSGDSFNESEKKEVLPKNNDFEKVSKIETKEFKNLTVCHKFESVETETKAKVTKDDQDKYKRNVDVNNVLTCSFSESEDEPMEEVDVPEISEDHISLETQNKTYFERPCIQNDHSPEKKTGRSVENSEREFRDINNCTSSGKGLPKTDIARKNSTDDIESVPAKIRKTSSSPGKSVHKKSDHSVELCSDKRKDCNLSSETGELEEQSETACNKLLDDSHCEGTKKANNACSKPCKKSPCTKTVLTPQAKAKKKKRRKKVLSGMDFSRKNKKKILMKPLDKNGSIDNETRGRFKCNKIYKTSPKTSVIRTVCSEYEPLPSPPGRKRKYLSDSDEEDCSRRRKESQEFCSVRKKERSSSQDSDRSHSSRRSTDGPSLPKKKYQKAGLFSNYFKEDDLKKKCDAVSKPKEKSSCQEPGKLLPPPLHVGKYLMEQTCDFQLPYDIFWLYENNLLHKKEDSCKYKRIRNNVYVGVKPVCRFEHHKCNCRRPLDLSQPGCREDCLNRLIYTECVPSYCPCFDNCSNQKIQKHEWAPGLKLVHTGDRGYGVKTTQPVKSGSFIIEYTGEVVTEQEFKRRMTEEYSQECHHYCLNLDSGTVIDGYRMGNLGRFVNHSCEPNCEMQKWNVNGLYRMCLFASKDIPSDTELSYDYNFHSFNIDAQQLCKCGSNLCRGVIGGRTQRLNGLSKDKHLLKSSGLKDKRKSKSGLRKLKEKLKQSNKDLNNLHGRIIPHHTIRPMSNRERYFARDHSIFLVRNIDKIRGDRHKPGNPEEANKEDDAAKYSSFTQTDVFLTQLTALNTARSVRTRRLALAEENTEFAKIARLAQLFKIIFSTVVFCKDDEGNTLSTHFMNLPSKKKHPQYYDIIDDPIDLNTIEKNITTGQYKNVESFDSDFLRLFRNVEKYCGRKSDMGKIVLRLRKVYSTAKSDALSQLDDMLGDIAMQAPQHSSSETEDSVEMSENREQLDEDEEEEEVIRCICNIYRDEGIMLQCEKCFVWQHCDCVGVDDPSAINYLCEQCCPRPVVNEILYNPQPDDAIEGLTYYMTLMRDELQVKIGECVYVTRDPVKKNPDGTPLRTSYRRLANHKSEHLDIFHVERLWKNENGERFAFGHLYYRPHETFHEPARRFFHNEVFRIPLYEVIPLEAVIGSCCVLDIQTYCKGRPKGVKEQDVYICEYRIDKTAHLFHKISKPRYPVNTKSYCFHMFEKRLAPKRVYSPHEVPDSYKRRGPGEKPQLDDVNNGTQNRSVDNRDPKKVRSPTSDSDEDLPLVQVKEQRRKQKRDKLNKLTLKMLNNLPGKKKVDLSYLLDGFGKRPRKKPQLPC